MTRKYLVSLLLILGCVALLAGGISLISAAVPTGGRPGGPITYDPGDENIDDTGDSRCPVEGDLGRADGG